jgi:hypothetical protein
MNSDQPRAELCPVCHARFRGAAKCPRCGAGLMPLMLLVAHAYRLRQQSRHALRKSDCSAALACAERAQQLHATPEGHLLQWVCAAARESQTA